MMKSKKAQITIFVVLGIVLLFSSMLIFVIKNQIDTSQSDYGAQAEAPFEVMPIKLMVENCLEKITIDALSMIAQQGGYINLSQFNIGVADDRFFLDSVSTDSLRFSSGLDWKIPYYWYMSSSNRCNFECRFETEKPDLQSNSPRAINNQLEIYIDQHLPECFDVGVVKQTIGKDVKILSNPRSDVIIAKDDIVVNTIYDMQINDASGNYDLSSFYVKLPVKLRKIYEVANAITNDHINEHFLETQFMDLVTLLGGLDNSLIPPVKETVFDLANLNFWLKSEVKTELENVLSVYVPAFQVVGSKNAAYFNPETLLQQGLYNRFNRFINLTDYEDLSDLNIEFLYFNNQWPIYLDMQGRGVRGEFIGPEFATISYIPMGIQRYYFYYQSSFPVVVKISDDSPLMKSIFGDGGFEYFFALEANLRDNNPIDVDYEEELSNPILTDTLCDPYHKTSGNITFNVTDYITGQPVDRALINFDLGRGSCMVVVTKNITNTTTTTMNPGIGYLAVSHPNYLETSLAFMANFNESQNVSIQLMPYKELEVVIKKYPSTPSNTGWFLNTEAPKDLVRNEMALITLDKVRANPSDPEYSYTAVYEYGEQAKIRLVPGTYDVTIYTLQNTPYRGDTEIVIEEDVIRVPSANPFGGGSEVPLPRIEFNSTFPEGETSLNSMTGNWVVTADSLYNSTNVTFFAITSPGYGLNSLTHDDLEQLGKNEEYVLEHRALLEPIFN